MCEKNDDTSGIGFELGNIELNPDQMPDDSYTLRAYTNWMRNFGEDKMFKTASYIANDPYWYIQLSSGQKTASGVTRFSSYRISCFVSRECETDETRFLINLLKMRFLIKYRETE